MSSISAAVRDDGEELTVPKIVFSTQGPKDSFESIPADGHEQSRGFTLIPAGHYSLAIQAEGLKKERCVVWGMFCTDFPVRKPNENPSPQTTCTAYGCVSAHEHIQTANFLLSSPKTWYLTMTATNSLVHRTTKISFILYRLPTPSPSAVAAALDTPTDPPIAPADIPMSPPSYLASSAPSVVIQPSVGSPLPAAVPSGFLGAHAHSPNRLSMLAPQTPLQQQQQQQQQAQTGFTMSQISLPNLGEQIYSSVSGMYYSTYKVLGEGSFGIALLGSDIYGQPYVLKAAKPFKAQMEVEADWRKEATLMMGLNHPNIIRLHDAFAYNGLFWLVIEQAAGSLSSYVSKLPDQRMPPRQLVECASQLLSGLEHIHMRGMIHRDIQLDNILYSRPSAGPDRIVVKISDFGIAKHLGYPATAGLPAYTRIGREHDMSPGALQGYATNRADFYQLGMILFHLYTGRPALSAEDGPYYQVIGTGLAQKRACALKTDIGDVIAKLLYVDENHLPSTARHCWALFSPVLYYMREPVPTPVPAPVPAPTPIDSPPSPLPST